MNLPSGNPRARPAAHASAFGLYAWALTVAPAAWAHGASVPPKVLAALGPLALLTGLLMTPRAGRLAERGAFWGLAGSSLLVWALTPSGSLNDIDPVRGVAGALGWGLFAFVSAAPAPANHAEADAGFITRTGLPPQISARWTERLVIITATVGAALLQIVGWRVVTPERALLVRVATVASGLAVVGSLAAFASVDRQRERKRPRRRTLSRELPRFAVVLLLLLGGFVAELSSR